MNSKQIIFQYGISCLGFWFFCFRLPPSTGQPPLTAAAVSSPSFFLSFFLFLVFIMASSTKSCYHLHYLSIDCDKTFSPMVKPAIIRIVLSIALSKSWSIHKLDVKNAFLHGHLTKTVYMHQPLGFCDPTHPYHVCLLRKSFYGLKKAPRA